MISLDMKYTSLYWALRFYEVTLDVHEKSYPNTLISIQAEKQKIDYGNKITVEDNKVNILNRHKDFVILECIDRLLEKGYNPEDISIHQKKNHPDIILKNNLAIYCCRWGKEYEKILEDFSSSRHFETEMIYTSRLVSGLLEYKNKIYYKYNKFSYGYFERGVQAYNPQFKNALAINIDEHQGFEIFDGHLIRYNGNDKIVKIPEGVHTISASAFWDNQYVEEVIIPESVKHLGGDAFYYCTSLIKIIIPSSIEVMGNDPFAGCPNLTLHNLSKYFNLVDGVLFNQDYTNLIHYPMNKQTKEYVIPDSVECLGKHSFFNCINLEKIVIPRSVVKFENNPFSGCENLTIENYSEEYKIIDGVIYNRFMTTVIGSLPNELKTYIRLPETITLISRNSFWNCKKIGKIVLSKNITRIGYNPFAGCENLMIYSENENYVVLQGVLYNKDLTEIICATNIIVGNKFKVPEHVKSINRGAFSGCTELETINFASTEIIEKSSFSNCYSLKNIYIPNSVNYIGEWAFAHCFNLEAASISKNTLIFPNTFSRTKVKVNIR